MITITREQEQTFPAFINHKSARKWFKQYYGNRMVMQGVTRGINEKVYLYHLVNDRDTYLKYWDELKEKGYVYEIEFINSYQTIEISDNGKVQINY